MRETNNHINLKYSVAVYSIYNYDNNCTRFYVDARCRCRYYFCVSYRTQREVIITTGAIVYCSTTGIFFACFFCVLKIYVRAIIVTRTHSKELLFPYNLNRKNCQIYFYFLVNATIVFHYLGF